MRISDWSSDVCSSDLQGAAQFLDDPLHQVATLGAQVVEPRLDRRAGVRVDLGERQVLEFVLDVVDADPRRQRRVDVHGLRSEERRVGKEGFSTFRTRGSPYQYTKKIAHTHTK